jgi:hypothetical protein
MSVELAYAGDDTGAAARFDEYARDNIGPLVTTPPPAEAGRGLMGADRWFHSALGDRAKPVTDSESTVLLYWDLV